jgi:hypothetical protein
MPTYTLSNTAADIDSAITRVASADTTPTDTSQNMVTSGGVKSYVDGEVGDFSGKTVTTSTDNFADNDTSIPTCAAVKDFVPSYQQTATARCAYFSTNSNTYQTVPLAHRGDSFLTVINNKVTIPVGDYLMFYGFEYRSSSGSTDNSRGPQLNINITSGISDFFGLSVFQPNASRDWRSETFLAGVFIPVTSTTSFKLQLKDNPASGTYTQYIKNLYWTCLKMN